MTGKEMLTGIRDLDAELQMVERSSMPFED